MQRSAVFLFALVVLCAIVVGIADNNSADVNAGAPDSTKSDETVGVVMLDSFTYPVLVNSQSPYSTFIMIYEKSTIQEYATASYRADYFRLALDFQKEMANPADDTKMLFAQVVVNGATNRRLAESLGYTRTARGSAQMVLPRFVLVKAGATGPRDHTAFSGLFERSELFRFLTHHTGVVVTHPGSLPAMDTMLGSFMRSLGGSEADLVAAEASLEQTRKLVSEQSDTALAEFYVAVMGKLLNQRREKGNKWDSALQINEAVEELTQVVVSKERLGLRAAVLERIVWQVANYYRPVVEAVDTTKGEL